MILMYDTAARCQEMLDLKLRDFVLNTKSPYVYITGKCILIILSILIGILVTTISALFACNKELKTTASVLMRPKSPQPGKKIILERIPVIWNRLSFSVKVTIRNIFRYKKRFFMTITGIIGCCALLLAGFGLNNSISQVVNKQYKEIFTYDLNMRYLDGAIEKQKKEVEKILGEQENVRSYYKSARINAKAKANGEEIDITLIVPSEKDGFNEFITLRQRKNQKAIDINNDGLIITEKLSKELNVKVGDSVEVNHG